MEVNSISLIFFDLDLLIFVRKIYFIFIRFRIVFFKGDVVKFINVGCLLILIIGRKEEKGERESKREEKEKIFMVK